MGFFAGRVTCLRFKVNGPAPRQFDDEHLARLSDHQAGRQRIASADGVETGWTAGEHILDTDFGFEKNIINDTLNFELRVDTEKLPGDLLRAYTAVELKALSKDNPSGFASARQKREAKEIARQRLEQEAKDGRYRKRKCVPVLWDRQTNEVLFGATSLTQVDRLTSLFEQTFGHELECVTAGRRAYQLAELHSLTRSVDDAAPSAFVPNASPDIAWIADDSSRDFIGNEFLLWLWYYTDIESDTLKLLDGSEVTLMLARTLNLECPRGQTGHETITHEGPTRLPEARRAIQSGKLPRKVGLTLVRNSDQYELTLHAETLGVGGAKLPPPDEGADARGKLDDRANQLRELVQTLDLLYDAFGQKRFSGAWQAELEGMQKWLKRGERNAA
ncbi:hypothetical protein GobsT_22260 [Gemmata obscuriglobus]|uniref:Recombination-associated protein RdgC n=1 Tax=Gemmata obscuriglobus TaxID=114 RepID=A0A2Z3H744_9BACT|nr:hypothetical protein [Gemmata obscuriglobus]AWM39447.1 hypothetical protein C1280_22285 [Gemmata obscuriglobus]QEG27470.1 hypothetical protein GobsT_22260 [Gemmata obscuriglobus]VTS04459.1 Uncharacterized protein OS=Singulisphaera acidiphila (strain ATCC BAA-1392 / DSM 18658 / VKM B-2454 / MOB10) GN=Sinac_0973 PE=4 SV=1 [Gemmata obscuriglobus UQM 2246]